jgi:hypothetical protein
MPRSPRRARALWLSGLVTMLGVAGLLALGPPGVLASSAEAGAAAPDDEDTAEDAGEQVPYAPADEPLAAAPDRAGAGPISWNRLPLWLQAWVASGFLVLAALVVVRALRWLAFRLNGKGEVTW